MAAQVATARVFYSLSTSTRSSPTFSNKGDTILPPFCRGAFAAALSSLGVRTHFVPRGEADGVCVVLAGQMGGYVLGRDTDFVILSAGASERLRGYAPLDMMEWTDSAPSEDAAGGAPAADFTTVSAKRPRSARSRLLPPTSAGNPTLVLATFATAPLCRRLRLNAQMLPLLSSLVGNDYTPAWAGEALFPRMRPGDRIQRVARVLAELRPSAKSAEDLVRRSVKRLWARPFVDDAAVAELTDAVIEATIQYVLPVPDCCDQFPFCGELDAGCRTATASQANSAAPSRAPTPISGNGNGKGHNAVHSDAIIAYAEALRRGRLSALTAAYLHPDRVHLWTALEDPSTASCRASVAACRARLAAYTILDAAVGGLRFPKASDDLLDEQKQDQEANRLLGVEAEEEPTEERPRVVTEFVRQGGGRIVARRAVLPPKDGEESGAEDVIGENSENAAPAAADENGENKGESQSAAADGNNEKDENDRNGQTSEAEAATTAEKNSEQQPQKTSSISRQDIRKEGDATPACLLPIAERQRLYLHHMGSDTDAILALPSRLHPLVAAVRLILAAGGDWTRSEIEALLKGCIGSFAAWDAVSPQSAPPSANADNDSSESTDESSNDQGHAADNSHDFNPSSPFPAVELTSRATRLVAALTSALQDSQPLSQALLLPPPHGSPHVWISGAATHALLNGQDPPPGAGWAWNDAAQQDWKRAVEATIEGYDLPTAVAETKKNKKKNRNAKKKAEENATGGKANGCGGKGNGGKGGKAKNGAVNRFDLLDAL